jgi:penicillin amidase
MRALLRPLVLAFAAALPAVARAETGKVEVLRDRWGVAHVFAERETDGFFGLGYAAAEDRLLQMDLMRRRAHGRLAEVFGADWVESDRKFRVAGTSIHCAEALAALPEEMRGYLKAYAAGVNAFVAANPERVKARFAPLGVLPEPWTPADSLAAWQSLAELFDGWIKESAVQTYHDFERLAAEVGPEAALGRRGMVIDDEAAVVSEAEMARTHPEAYARLKRMPRTPGFTLRSPPEEPVRFSHAWAVGGKRSTTGKPILESDPQTTVNHPPLWYEFHLSAGRYDVRGIGPVGCPCLLVGWNRRVAWGATALGGGCSLAYIDRLADGGWQDGDRVAPFSRRVERIDVKGGRPVFQEVLTNRHGFVFNALVKSARPGLAYVGHYRQAIERGTSVRAMLQWMRAANWGEFQGAMEHYYSPGIHLLYADVDDNIAYQTLVNIPRTRRTVRMALEGWTGQDEIVGRIPLHAMPHMLNPQSNTVFHANNLPVGSWYPFDLGLAKGGIGDSVRSMRLRQLLSADRKWSLDDFESVVHRDTINPAVAALLPAARKVVEQDRIADRAVADVLRRVHGWDFRMDAGLDAYPVAVALADAANAVYRRAGLADRFGGGESGLCHLARVIGRNASAAPADPALRAFLVAWLRTAGELVAKAPTPPIRHVMPFQAQGPLKFPRLDAARDLLSPPLTCGYVGTIWSQHGNSYTQIVDLADVDNSRSVLPPGVTEDAASPYHAAQMDVWVKGTTHPAPLSRGRVEAVLGSRIALTVAAYSGPAHAPARTAEPPSGTQALPAIPAAR